MDFDTILDEGIEYGKKGNFSESIDSFVKIIKNNKHHVGAWHALGITMRKMGETSNTAEESLLCFNEAIRTYDTLIKIDETDAEAWYEKGSILSDYLEKPVEALECLKKVLELDENHVGALMNMGIIMDDNDQPIEAIRLFKIALKIDETNQSLWYNSGVTLARVNLNKEALDCFTKSIQLDNTHANSWKNKARILKILGDEKESEFCMKKFELLISNP